MEESVLGVSGADDQITIWDLSVEHDPEENSGKIIGKNGVEVPPQILFIHQVNIYKKTFYGTIICIYKIIYCYDRYRVKITSKKYIGIHKSLDA